MQEQILSIIQEAINNIYFIPILIIFAILIIIKSKLNYIKYKKSCEIFQQKPKLTGYIKNSLTDIIGIMTIITIAFIGYVGLDQSKKFENTYKKKIEKNDTPPKNTLQYKNTNNIKKIEKQKTFKIVNIDKTKRKKENWKKYEYKNGIKTTKEYKNKKLVKETIEYKNGKVITKEYTNNPFNMIIETEK